MSWNYRVLVLPKEETTDDEDYFFITEVYYDKNGVPEAYIEEEVGVSSIEGKSGLEWTLDRYKEAL